MTISTGDAGGLVDTLQKWLITPAIVAEMGRRARSMLDAKFTLQQGLARWRNLLDRL